MNSFSSASIASLRDPTTPDKPRLFLLEFQSQIDEDKLDVTFEEVGILRSRTRHGPKRKGKFIVMSALIYLCDRCPEEVIDMMLPGDKGTFHAPLIWNVADDDAVSTLEAVADGRVSWGMLFWLPLMSGSDDDNFVRRWRKVVIAKVESKARRTELAIIAIVFAELANRRPIWERGLEGFEQMESQVVNNWLRKGDEGGQLKKAREVLLKGLRLKYPGAMAPEVSQLISTQESLAVLDDWFEAFCTTSGYDEFFAVLSR